MDIVQFKKFLCANEFIKQIDSNFFRQCYNQWDLVKQQVENTLSKTPTEIILCKDITQTILRGVLLILTLELDNKSSWINDEDIFRQIQNVTEAMSILDSTLKAATIPHFIDPELEADDIQIAILVKSLTWRPSSRIEDAISKTIELTTKKGGKQLIMKSPISKLTIEEMTTCRFEESTTIVIGWYHLVQQTHLTMDIRSQLKSWADNNQTKLIVITQKMQNQWRNYIFTNDEIFYKTLKKNSFTITIGNNKIVFQSQAKYKQCMNCEKIYASYHPITNCDAINPRIE
uniref:Uncharacterized protein n=1 Tax=Tetranychus urticae TaxID=32264 RepID=T1L3Z7_TETUR